MADRIQPVLFDLLGFPKSKETTGHIKHKLEEETIIFDIP